MQTRLKSETGHRAFEKVLQYVEFVLSLPKSSGQAIRQAVRQLWRWRDWRWRWSLAVLAAFACIVLLPASTAEWLGAHHVSQETLWNNAQDATVSLPVYIMDTAQTRQVRLNDYLVGVLAAEMSPNAPPDALEAAAVAARTYAVHAMVNAPKKGTWAANHGAAVTDSPQYDLPYWDMSTQETEFGQNTDVDTLKFRKAVLATDGLILVYQDKPILAFQFAQSAGWTRDGETWLHQSVPYLASRPCPDDQNETDMTERTFTPGELVKVLKLNSSMASSASSASSGSSASSATSIKLNQFRVAGADNHGYVKSVQYGALSWSGDEFAALLGLPSTVFTMKVSNSNEGLTVTNQGQGEGYGMSLHEAVAMAGNQSTYTDILDYFYPGAELVEDTTYVSSAIATQTPTP